MKKRPRIAILASGSGSTAEAVAEGTLDGRLDAVIALIIYNNPNAGIIDQPTIKQLGIPAICINGSTHPSGKAEKGSISDEESEAVLNAIQVADCQLVILLGYMKKVRGALLSAYGYSDKQNARILNTHPGPLPQTIGFYGRNTHQKVYELFKSGSISKTGPTLHQVSANYDEGPIVQFADEVELTDDDTVDTIEERVRMVERRVTPIGINKYLKELT